MTTNAVTFSNPSELFDPTPFGFCHTVKAPANGETIYISGQSGGEGQDHILNDDFRHQVKSLLKNLEFALNSHELTFSDVVKITILIVDHNFEKLSIWGEEMNQYWSENALPASTLIPVPALALEGMQIEVDAIAFKPA